VDGEVLARTRTPSLGDLPWAYPESLTADVRINVPYRTQLDGSEYEGANCGPTALGMALESFGVNLEPSDLRFDVLNSEEFNPADNDAGSFIWALADVAQRHQVLVITHLPQIAARADNHLVVSKAARRGIATSDVQIIHGEDRVSEIARMLGDAEGDASRRHAQAMLRRERALQR
jgi:DNA repair protein RecN (Recombination protein N)